MSSSQAVVLTILLALSLALVGCVTPVDVSKQIDGINNRSYASDAIVVEEHVPLVLPPKEKYKSVKEAAIKLDTERRTLRAIIEEQDKALGYKNQELRHLLAALKAMEIESRAIERMLVRTQAMLEMEKRSAAVDRALSSIKQVLLVLGILVVASP